MLNCSSLEGVSLWDWGHCRCRYRVNRYRACADLPTNVRCASNSDRSGRVSELSRCARNGHRLFDHLVGTREHDREP